jgi:hypothetical protein
MPVYGTIRTMSLPDLLQWASVNKMTGVLELERDKICKRITFREGRIVACSSDDPPSRLGQFLLSRGKITKEQLRGALARQEVTGENLGMIFQGMGVLTREDVEAHVAAKAEENIYGLFDWTDAVFRFHEEVGNDPFIIEVDLSVPDVVLKGIQRFDDIKRIREAFTTSGIVLQRTERQTPPEVTSSAMARRVLESVDGRRTLAEILLHAHASEYLVLKFLYTLLRKGMVAITEVRDPDPNSRTLLDPTLAAPLELRSLAPLGSREEIDRPGPDPAAPKARDREAAIRCMAEGDHAGAMEILNECYRARPDDDHLRQLLLRAEAGFLEHARGGAFAPSRIPVPLAPSTQVSRADLHPTEAFLLTMLDGRSDIKSLLWLAPLREVDVMKGLERLHRRGLIELRDPEPSPATQPGEDDGEQPVPSVQWSPI